MFSSHKFKFKKKYYCCPAYVIHLENQVTHEFYRFIKKRSPDLFDINQYSKDGNSSISKIYFSEITKLVYSSVS